MVPKKSRKEPALIKRSEYEALEYAESIINTVREPLVVLDQDLRVVSVSRSFYEFFQVKPEETLGQLIYNLGNKQWDIPKLRELLETILPQKVAFDNYEVEHHFATIGRRVMLLNARQIQRVLGKEQIILLAVEDITKHKLLEKALEEKTADVLSASEEKYRLLVENINDVFYILDNQGNITYVSPAVERFTKYKASELIGKPFNPIIYPADLPDLLDSFNRLASGHLEPWEFRVQDKDGNVLFVRSSSKPIYKDGQITGYTALMIDITDRKLAEEALKASEAQYRLIADHTTDFIWLMDMNLKPTYHSPSAEKLTGFTHKEIIELPLGKRITPESLKLAAEVFLKELPRVEADPGYNPVRTLELEYYNKDGTIMWAESKFSILRDESGRPVSILGEARDITKRKQAEEKLLKSYQSLKKTLSDAIDTMVKIVETRDPYTAGHQHKVADLVIAIAGEMKLDAARIDNLRTAALIHDIGKMYVPSDILSKPGKLADIEFSLIKTHSKAGYDIVKDMDFPGNVAQVILQHHERLDGSGYPNQLKAEDTLLEAKILVVSDVVEAMSSHRPYRPALGMDKALEEISNGKGKLYDPEVVDTCVKLFKSGRFEFKSV